MAGSIMPYVPSNRSKGGNLANFISPSTLLCSTKNAIIIQDSVWWAEPLRYHTKRPPRIVTEGQSQNSIGALVRGGRIIIGWQFPMCITTPRITCRTQNVYTLVTDDKRRRSGDKMNFLAFQMRSRRIRPPSPPPTRCGLCCVAARIPPRPAKQQPPDRETSLTP